MFFTTKKRFGLLITLSIILNGCGFYLQTKTEVPAYLRTMTFYSTEPYGFLAREVKNNLINNDVTLVEDNDITVPTLRIKGSEINKVTASVYQDGKAAEYQLVLIVHAEVVIAKQGIYPITVKIFRSFFDNPSAALAKNTEQTLIRQEMYRQAAEQLVRKLKTVKMVQSESHD